MTTTKTNLFPYLNTFSEETDLTELLPQDQGLIRFATNEWIKNFFKSLDVKLDGGLYSALNSVDVIGKDELLGSLYSPLVNFASASYQLYDTINARAIREDSSVVEQASLESEVNTATYTTLFNLFSSFTNLFPSQTNSTVNKDLFPDLIIKIENLDSPALFPEEQGLVRVVVTNQGKKQFAGPLNINLYASVDSTLDLPLNEGNLVGKDELLGSLDSLLVNLSSGESQEFFIDFAGSQVRNPSVVAPGSYYLIAEVEAANYVTESDTKNNLGSVNISVNNSDVVIDWNATALNAVQTTNKFAPIAARDLAIVHAAIYDAVNAIDRSYKPYLVNVQPSLAKGASPEAAVTAAAYTTLVSLFPSQKAEFDLQFKRSLAEIPDDAAKLKGLILGRNVAKQILEIRSTDGADIFSGGSYPVGTEPGEWRPTPPNFLPAGFSQWGQVTPFVIPSVDDYLGEGFPEITSEEYAAQINEVKAIGSVDSLLRTDEQTEIAKFWSFDRTDSFGVTGFWNKITQEIAIQQDNTLVENARLFALLNFGQADSGIAVLASKYNYNLWRPVTAIREADNDGNLYTVGDPDWIPLLPTPPNPEYLGGHAIGGGAAAAVLTDFFGEDFSFTTTSPETPGISRSFGSFYKAAVEDTISRLYGGVHYRITGEESLALGIELGNYVVDYALV